MVYYRLWLIFPHPKIVTLFFALFEDFQIKVSDSGLDMSTNSERKWNIRIWESKFGCWPPKINQILKLKISLLFNGSLYTLRFLFFFFFYWPSIPFSPYVSFQTNYFLWKFDFSKKLHFFTDISLSSVNHFCSSATKFPLLFGNITSRIIFSWKCLVDTRENLSVDFLFGSKEVWTTVCLKFEFRCLIWSLFVSMHLSERQKWKGMLETWISVLNLISICIYALVREAKMKKYAWNVDFGA